MADMLEYGDKGPRVKELQRLCNHNTYRRVRRLLEVDGEFGPLTAAAVQGTKFWMGYAKDDIEPVAGDFFMALIKNGTPLPGAYHERRKDRLERVAEGMAEKLLADKTRKRALGYAKADVGTLEAPNNAIKYNSWWTGGDNDGGAYCVRAASYWYAKAGSRAVARGSRWENTDVLLADAKAGRNGVHLVSDPAPGAVFVIDFSGRSDPDHCGVYVKDVGNGSFQSVEANALLANGKQGVGFHTRAYRNCWHMELEK
jgi:peptidoglycan hydrolase-like protein with peptidoglycan-binding domain